MAKSLEKTYDGIIIGAGHHGLILGSYLALASAACRWRLGCAANRAARHRRALHSPLANVSITFSP
jgi:hypothetical protein